MSLPTETQVTCPHCGNEVSITHWQTVNATLHPALRRRVLNGSIIRHHCPTCNQGFGVKGPLLYHDVKRRFMVWLDFEVPGAPPPTWRTDTLETSAAALKDYQFRLVSEWDELVEKINIFENGWDDRILETLKLFVIERVFPFGSQDFNESTARLTRLVDDGSEWGAFNFEITKGDTVVGEGTVPTDLYDKLAAGQEERFGKNCGAGEWTMVNKATILSQPPKQEKQRTAPHSDDRVFSRQQSKTDLIRSLLKARLRDDPVAKIAGVSPETVDQQSDEDVLGAPEATIVTIVESYIQLSRLGFPEPEILRRIEKHRSMIGSDTMPSPLTLRNYIRYRVSLEYAHTAPVSDASLDSSISAALEYFGPV